MNSPVENLEKIIDLPENLQSLDSGMTVFQYIDTDGDLSFAFSFHGHSNVATMLGLLSMVSHKMLHDANPER